MIPQIAIFIFGASAIYLVSRDDKFQKWGYIMGLLGQPFWIYVTFTNDQWGILAMTIAYTLSWCNGIWNHWIKPYLRKDKLKEEAKDIKELKKTMSDVSNKLRGVDQQKWVGKIPKGYTEKEWLDEFREMVEKNKPKQYKCQICKDTGVINTDFSYEYHPCDCQEK
jgi:hypothetical protein